MYVFILMLVNLKRILYYCISEPGHKVTIHRGGKDGSVLAIARHSLQNASQTIIDFVESDLSISILEDQQESRFRFNKKSRFSFGDQNYYWKGHKTLWNDQANDAIAIFHPTWLEGQNNKIGRLDILPTEIQDIIVITAVVIQERYDEHKLSVAKAFLVSNYKG
jgi:hypothetical protein